MVVQMRKEVAAENHAAAAALFKKCSSLTMPILFPIGVFFAVNAESVMTLLYTDEYRNAAVPFSIYSATVLIRSWSGTSWTTKRPRIWPRRPS